MINSVAIIGSFKQFYEQVLEALNDFKRNGVSVTSPIGSAIIEQGIPFVRFTSDDPNFSDEMVQTVTLKRILSATAVYVVNPNGYVGKTTCYEIGRILQSRKPLYFSSTPKDLPIEIPPCHVIDPNDLSKLIFNNKVTWPFDSSSCDVFLEERNLLDNFK